MAPLPPASRSRTTRPKKGTKKPDLTQAERDKIAALHAKGKGRNEIAREIGRSAYSVTKVVKELGLSFDEAATVEATAARVAQMKARRVDLAEKLLDDALKLRERLWSPHNYYERGQDAMIPMTLPLPPLRDARDGYAALQIALKGHMDLIAGSTDSSVEDKRSVLANLIDRIKTVVDEDKKNGAPPPDTSVPVNDEAGTAAEQKEVAGDDVQ